MKTLEQFKWDRLRQTAETNSIGAFITSLPEHTEYYSGFYPSGMSIVFSTECYLVVNPHTGAMGLVSGAADAPTALEDGFTGGYYAYGSFRFHSPDNASARRVSGLIEHRFASPAEAIHAALGDLAPGADSIAADEARMPPSTWLALAGLVGKARLVPGTPFLQQAMAVKHPDEVAMLRKSAQFAEDAFFEMTAQIKPGISEDEMARLYRLAATRRNTDPFFCVATANERAAYSDTVNRSGAVARDHSMIRFDFGVIYKNWFSDLSRTVVLGHNEKAESYYRAVLAGETRAIETIRPGITAGEVFDATVKAVRAEGIPHYWRHHVGHGIGVSTYVCPSLSDGNPAVLEEGMVLCVETPYYELGWGGVQVEDTVVVTATGAEYLTKSSRELLIL